jgi:hypothetical protein
MLDMDWYATNDQPPPLASSVEREERVRIAGPRSAEKHSGGSLDGS